MTQGGPIAGIPGLDLNFLLLRLEGFVGAILMALGALLAFRWFLRSPVGEAMAERIRAGTRRRFGAGSGDPSQVAALEDQVGQLQGQVNELAERLDFAERLLARGKEPERLRP